MYDWMVWRMGQADQQTWLALEMRDKDENREMLWSKVRYEDVVSHQAWGRLGHLNACR